MKRRVCVVILDGWGLRDREEGNAIRQANTPNFERLWHENPHLTLDASGEAMGLPKGQMGTSEIGHMTIGSGRIIFQDLVKLNQAIESGSFFENPEIKKLMLKIKKNHSALHLMGLVSDGGVHSHYSHLYALLKMAKDLKLKKVWVHAFTDGRDCSPKSGLGFIEDLEQQVKIATVSGRYFAMDRDHNWDRIDKAYKVIVKPHLTKATLGAAFLIGKSYQAGITDEFIKPMAIGSYPGMKQRDGAIFFNFRNDRPRQLLERFLQKGPKGVSWVTMTQYKPDYPVKVAYPPEKLDQALGEVLAKEGLKQLRVTETEKFAHLTFFLNCKREAAYEGEDRIMIDSYSDIKTHDEKPEMRCQEITKEVIQAMTDKTHEVIFTNLCNADMVGHTGNFKATVKAVETIDKCLAQISETAKNNHYDLIITADHGNAEEMLDAKTGEPRTSHTINPVPFILQSRIYSELSQGVGTLADIAPTILKLLAINQPKVMTGTSLL